MVNKEVILKTFNDILVKCGQRLRLNSKLLPAFNTFHDKHCGKKPRKTEIAIFVDENGDAFFTKKGTKKRVGFTQSEIEDAYEEHGEFNLTHNHPRDSVRPPCECLSTGDLNFLTQQISQYGKRDDGSEGFLGYVYPCKSISCESSNGTRMTAVRGDNFSDKDVQKFKSASNRLNDYFQDYYSNFYDTMAKVRKNVDINDFPNYTEYRNYVYKNTMKEMDLFENTSEFKEIQKEFRDANCTLTMTYPSDFEVGLWE